VSIRVLHRVARRHSPAHPHRQLLGDPARRFADPPEENPVDIITRPTATVPRANGASSLIHQASVVFGHVAIIALGGSVTGAPAADQIITDVWSDVIVDVTAAPYGNVDTGDMYLEYEGSGRAASASTSNAVLEDDSAVNLLPWAPAQLSSDTWNALGDYMGKGLALEIPSNLGPLHDGHPANTIAIATAFLVRDRATSRYLTVDESGWNEATRTFA